MSKQYICKQGWRRHSKGAIISEWEWTKLAIESRESHFEEYIPEPIIEIEPPALARELEKELKDRGITSKFKSKVADGKTELDATFTFENE